MEGIDNQNLLVTRIWQIIIIKKTNTIQLFAAACPIEIISHICEYITITTTFSKYFNGHPSSHTHQLIINQLNRKKNE